MRAFFFQTDFQAEEFMTEYYNCATFPKNLQGEREREGKQQNKQTKPISFFVF